MAVEKIGLDLTLLSNISTQSINFTVTQDILNNAPIIANEITGNWFGAIVMFVVGVMLYFTFSDKTPNADFRYDDIRAFSLALGFVTNLGILMLQIGFFSNVRHVGFVLLMFVIAEVIILFIETKNDT